MSRIISVAVLMFMVVPVWTLPSFWDEGSNEEILEAIITLMTDEELLGQVFFLGYQGTSPSPLIRKWVSLRCLGGLKIFTRNIETLSSIAADIHDMQTLASRGRFGIPLLVATDQEGGWVHHIRDGMLVVPGNLALGAGGTAHDAYLTGYHIGRELALLGINMNYAPTVDVYSNPENTVIGPRAFSSDPVATGLLACAYFNGMRKAGILCTAKHYPGHGGAEEDSHGVLPLVNVSWETMWDRELLPYRFLIREGIPAVMTGHLSFPLITDDGLPATLSSFFLQTVLRERLGFKGLVITDDLEMYGANDGYIDTAAVSRKALSAGCDMVLISHSPDRQEAAWKELLPLIKKESDFRSRVADAARRVLLLKLIAFRGEHPSPIYPDTVRAAETIRKLQEEESMDAAFQSTCRAVTFIRKGVLPWTPVKGERVLIVGQYGEYISEGKARHPDATIHEYSYYPPYYSLKEEREAILTLARSHDTIVFLLVNDNSLEILSALEGSGKRIIVVSSLSPAYLRKVPWVRTAIAVYGTSRDSFTAGFAAIAGDFEPQGRNPLRF